MQKKISTVRIGKIFGCSGRAIRDHMESLGMPRLGNGYLHKGVPAPWSKGIKRTQEQLKRLSMAVKLGYSNGTRKTNLGNGSILFKCEVCNKDVFEKPYRKKRTCSRECKNRLMTILRGENHWNHKEPSSKYWPQRQRLWIESREWRTKIFEKDDFTCVKCLKKGGRLCGHHLDSWSRHPGKRFDLNNGATLCWPCHRSFHDAYGMRYTTKEMFKEWLEG